MGQPEETRFHLRLETELNESGLGTTDITWSPNGIYIAACTSDSVILIWDSEKKRLFRRIGLRRILAISAKGQKDDETECAERVSWVPSLTLNTSWSNEGDVLAFTSRMNSIALADMEVQLPPEVLPHIIPQVTRLAWLPTSRWIAACSMRSLWIVDVSGNSQPRKVCDTGFAAYAMKASADGRHLAVSSHTGAIHIFGMSGNDLKPLVKLPGADSSSYGLAWCPRTGRLAVCLGDATVGIFSGENMTLEATVRGHQAPCLSVAFSPDGRMLASKSVDDTVRLWDCTSWKELDRIEERTGKIFGSIAFHPQRLLLATRGQEDVGIRIWSIRHATDNTTVRAEGEPAQVSGHVTLPATQGHGSYQVASPNTGLISSSLVEAVRSLVEADPPLISKGTTPQCFISYARGQSQHERQVEDLACFLREHCGVEVLFDRWSSLPGESLVKYLFDGLQKSSFILVIGTPQYRAKSEEKEAVLKQEVELINNIILKGADHEQRVLPLLLEGERDASFPESFHHLVSTDCRDPKNASEYLFELVARIRGVDLGDPRVIGIRRGLSCRK